MLQGRQSAILSTFIKLPFVIKLVVLSIFEWSLKTGFTVYLKCACFGLSQKRLLEAKFEDPKSQLEDAKIHNPCVYIKVLFNRTQNMELHYT